MLKFIFDSEAEIPAGQKDLYKETGGKWILQVEGAVPKATLDEFRTNNINLTQERDKLLLKFKDVDPTEYATLKARADELDEGKLIKKDGLEAAVTARVQKMKDALETQIRELTGKYQKATDEMGRLKIDQALIRAGTEAGLRPEAVQDFVNRGRSVFSLDPESGEVIALEPDGKTKKFGATGTVLGIDEYVKTAATDKSFSHLFAPSQGGGAPGGGRAGNTTVNPFKPGPGFNLTQQAAMTRSDPAAAARLKAEAGAV